MAPGPHGPSSESCRAPSAGPGHPPADRGLPDPRRAGRRARGESRAEVLATGELRGLTEDHPNVAETTIGQDAAGDGGARGVSRRARLAVGPEDGVVRDELRSSTTSMSPPSPDAHTGGSPSIGALKVPSDATSRSRPGRSETRSRPSGRNATAQGLSSPEATVTCSQALHVETSHHFGRCPDAKRPQQRQGGKDPAWATT